MPKRVKIKVLSLGRKFYSNKSEDPWVGQNFTGHNLEEDRKVEYIQFARDGDIEIEEGKYYEGREVPSKKNPDQFIFDRVEELDESLEAVPETPFQKRHTHSKITKAADANNKSMVVMWAGRNATFLVQALINAGLIKNKDEIDSVIKSKSAWYLALHDELVKQ